MIKNMDMVSKSGLTVNNMKVSILMDLRKVEVSLLGLMEILMKVSLKTIKWKGLESLNGKIRNMKVNGKIVR